MHMSDALLSPAVGASMLAATAGTVAYCSTKLKSELDHRKVPLMGVLGAFLFAAQMVNFSIPVTGSSGHLGGGLLLSVLLGPYAAFLTMASVLVVQALFFADGGLLALGCNIFNLGFFPAFIAYPLVYRKIARTAAGDARISTAAILASVIALQLGSCGVVLETFASGITELPLVSFFTVMQPIHLAIGVVEGLVTAAIISFIYKQRPDVLHMAGNSSASCGYSMRKITICILAAAVITGGIFSMFASKQPDGLEWSISRITGNEEFKGPDHGLHGSLARIQDKIAILPDYTFRKTADISVTTYQTGGSAKNEIGGRIGSSVSGLLGGTITLMLTFLIGFILKKRAQQISRD